MKYTILETASISFMENLVHIHMQKGWKPQGGLAITKHNMYVQAMILEVEDENS